MAFLFLKTVRIMAENKNKKAQPPATSSFFGIYVFEFIVLALAAIALAYFYYQSVTGGFEGFFQNPTVARFVLVLKIISAFVVAAALIGIGVVTHKHNTALLQAKKIVRPSMLTGHTKTGVSSVDAPHIKGEWEKLRKRLDVASDADAAHLIIEADALLDRALKDLRIPGETMGERLKFVSTPDFKSADDLWDAHKMRNQVAHGEGKHILYADALYAFQKFEKALKELNMI